MRAASFVSVLIIFMAGAPLIYFLGEARSNTRHAGDYQAGLEDGAKMETARENRVVNLGGLCGYAAMACEKPAKGKK